MRARGAWRGPGAARRITVQLVALTAAAAVVAVMYQLSAEASARVSRERGYAWNLPKDFPEPAVPKSNPMTALKAEAGHRLFYDERLSGNQQQSCASCHRPDRAFTDGRAQTVGSTGQMHPRGAPSLVNSAYNQTLAWANPSLTTYESQMLVPLFGDRPIELGVNDKNRAQVLRRIRRDPWYRRQFKKAFPGQKKPITWTTIVRSIASFERTIISANSRYDRYQRKKAELTAAQRRGMTLFTGERAECHHCHGTFIFSDQMIYAGQAPTTPQFHNTGLYDIGGTGAFPEDNIGLKEITGKTSDMGRFRAPSLRNVELTAPYMHDGSIETLEDAVDHYADGGRTITEGPFAGDGRKNPFKDPLVGGIDLTPGERADLVEFLKALTDRTIATNPRFADPFKKPGVPTK